MIFLIRIGNRNKRSVKEEYCLSYIEKSVPPFCYISAIFTRHIKPLWMYRLIHLSTSLLGHGGLDERV